MLILVLAACTETSSPDPEGPGPTSSTSPPTASETAAPPGPLGCTTVEGTRNVWVVSRSDPSLAASPSQPPDPLLRAHSLAGPDALGRVYLLDDSYVLLRSDDDGCSWRPVWTFLEAMRLWTSPETERLYARVPSGGNEGLLWASDDGGELFEAVTEAVPGPLVGAWGAQEVRADSGTSLYGATDGGQTWQHLVGYPTQALGVRMDPSDLRRIAYVSADNERELWLYDGTTWTSQSPDPIGDLVVVSWKGDALVLLSRREGEAPVFLHSETGEAPFTEASWGPLEDDVAGGVAKDGPRLVVAGHNAPPGAEWTDIEGFIAIVDGTTRHRHEMPGFDGILGISVTETSIVVGLQSTLDIAWW
jgi:hypothetical protein